MNNLAQQYSRARELASEFVLTYGLIPLWDGQAALDIVCCYTDTFEVGLSVKEKSQRLVLRAEWLAIVHRSPLDGIAFGYREEMKHENDKRN